MTVMVVPQPRQLAVVMVRLRVQGTAQRIAAFLVSPHAIRRPVDGDHDARV